MAPARGSEAVHSKIRHVVASCPAIDNHCHNLVALDSSMPFHCFLTEAGDAALADGMTTIAFKRNLRNIAHILNCPPTVEAIASARSKVGLEGLTKLFWGASNLEGVLIDDGLLIDKIQPIAWHRPFVPYVGRVMRLETIAQQILDQPPARGWTLDSFEKLFLAAIDPPPQHVISFKSITAYRCGLRVDPTVTREEAEEGLQASLAEAKAESRGVRLNDKRICNFVFLLGLEVATKHALPLQIHTGFGDKDLDLLLANPLHLRAVLEDPRFATSKLVLLHTSHPYSKEASYLAHVYAQVYLDWGLVFHMLSTKSIQDTTHDLFSMTPLSKGRCHVSLPGGTQWLTLLCRWIQLMYSADGAGLPEIFYIGSKWGRETLSSLLCDYFDAGDLSEGECLQAAVDILKNNAVRIYGLDLPPTSVASLVARGGGGGGEKRGLATVEQQTNGGAAKRARGNAPDSSSDSASKLVRLLFQDSAGRRRLRAIPTGRFDAVTAHEGVGICTLNFSSPSFTSASAPGGGVPVTGELRLVPDLSTRVPVPWCPGQEAVLGTCYKSATEVSEYCARGALIRAAQALETEFGLVVEAAYECEWFYFKGDSLEPVDQTSYCSTAGFNALSHVLSEIVAAAEGCGIEVEQIHCEDGQGQFEVSYRHGPALKAADQMFILKEIILGVGQKHGVRATFIGSPLARSLGSGAHVHLSLSRNGRNVFPQVAQAGAQWGMSLEGQQFMAGVLEHLRGIMAIAAPLPNSYRRLQPNRFAGVHAGWGFENRNASLRTSSPPGAREGEVTNFEFKSGDGASSPHLLLAVLIAAGMDGLRNKTKLPPPLDSDPGLASNGSVPLLPLSLQEAAEAFRADAVITKFLGPEYSQCLYAVRMAEVEHFKGMSAEEEVAELINFL